MGLRVSTSLYDVLSNDNKKASVVRKSNNADGSSFGILLQESSTDVNQSLQKQRNQTSRGSSESPQMRAVRSNQRPQIRSKQGPTTFHLHLQEPSSICTFLLAPRFAGPQFWPEEPGDS